MRGNPAVQTEPSGDAQKEATSAIIFLMLGAGMFVMGDFLLALFGFAVAGYLGLRWSTNEQLRRVQEEAGVRTPFKKESITQAFSSMVRAAFDLRTARRNLALLSLVLSLIFVYWGHLNHVPDQVPSKTRGEEAVYSWFLLLNACLYWCLGFRIPTYFRRWIAGGALFVSLWNWIGILQLPSDSFRDPSDIVRVSELIFLPMVGAFIALAIISFVDDEEVETPQPRGSALG
jgi:hypothetical protein